MEGDSTKLSIWTNRLTKELESLQEKLPANITLLQHTFQPGEGKCKGTFRIAVEETDLGLGEGQEVVTGAFQEVVVEMDLDMTRTRYPFSPPMMRVTRGAENIPPAFLQRNNSITLPDLEVWTPSQSMVTVLVSLRDLIASGGPIPADDDLLLTSGEGVSMASGQAVNLDLFEGTIYPCHVTTAQGKINRYLGVTSSAVVDLSAHPTKINWVVVVRTQDLRNILKLKFRRNLSITILFRDDSVWDFDMEESGDCVQAIQDQLGKVGIQGKKTTLAAANQIERAKDILLEIERKEKELPDYPALERINEIMSMYREATEKLAAVSNEKHQEVLEALHKFLQRPDVIAILEGKAPQPPPKPLSGGLKMPQLPKSFTKVLKGEILERHPRDVMSEDDDGLSREENRLLKYGLSQLKKMMDFNLDESGGLRASSTGSSSSHHVDESVSLPPPLPSHDSTSLSTASSIISNSNDDHVQHLEGMVTEATKEFAELSRISGGDDEIQI